MQGAAANFDSRSQPINEAEAREQLAQAYRIADRLGLSDLIWGHISLKIPNSEHFLTIDFPQLWNAVDASALVKVDIKGNIITDPTGKGMLARIHPAWQLHGAIHSHRPDANCIVHSHTTESMAFVGSQMKELLPLNQEAMAFHKRLSYHEYNTTPYMEGVVPGVALSMGPKNRAMILQGHGLMTTGETVGEAVIRMHYLNKCMAAQLKVMAAGVQLAPQPDDISEEFATKEETDPKDQGYGGPGRYEWEALIAQDNSMQGTLKGKAGWKDVLDFWFLKREWYGRYGHKPQQDKYVRERFGSLLVTAFTSGLAEWEMLGCEAALAAVIAMDQLPRMAFRGKPAAFAAEKDALAIAKRLIASAEFRHMNHLYRLFAIMPLQHSENLEDQNHAVELMEALALDNVPSTKLKSYLDECAEHARKHRDVVASFGRFPHKSTVIGRDTSEAELAFLEDGAGWAQVLDFQRLQEITGPQVVAASRL